MKTLVLLSVLSQILVGKDQPQAPSGYILGANDQISVFVREYAEEFAEKTFRIDSSGEVSLPIMGHIHAAGLTTSELEQSCKQALLHELKDPQVTITLVAFGSQTVSVLGSVNQPGQRQLEGHKSLFEVLALAGGLKPDAGAQVTITRDMKWGKIPLTQATVDQQGKTSAISIKLIPLMKSANPSDNIDVLPGDIIFVPATERVYAVGCVAKPGAFSLDLRDTISALQIVSLAEGPTRFAALSKAKILRAVPGSQSRTEISVNLKDLMAGKGSDVQLQPEDILFVPTSNAKAAGFRTIDAITSAATYASMRAY